MLSTGVRTGTLFPREGNFCRRRFGEGSHGWSIGERSVRRLGTCPENGVPVSGRIRGHLQESLILPPSSTLSVLSRGLDYYSFSGFQVDGVSTSLVTRVWYSPLPSSPCEEYVYSRSLRSSDESKGRERENERREGDEEERSVREESSAHEVAEVGSRRAAVVKGTV